MQHERKKSCMQWEKQKNRSGSSKARRAWFMGGSGHDPRVLGTSPSWVPCSGGSLLLPLLPALLFLPAGALSVSLSN